MQLLASLLLAPVVTAAILPRGSPPAPGSWTLGAYQPSSSWLGEPINANGGLFYIGKAPSSVCYTWQDNPDQCSVDKVRTWFDGGSYPVEDRKGWVWLHVSLYAGQSVYIGPDGELAYTQAVAPYVPVGSQVGGWNREISTASGSPTVLSFSSDGKTWLPPYACPVAGQKGVWQVFMRQKEGCVSIQLRTYSMSEGAVVPTPYNY